MYSKNWMRFFQNETHISWWNPKTSWTLDSQNIYADVYLKQKLKNKTTLNVYYDITNK